MIEYIFSFCLLVIVIFKEEKNEDYEVNVVKFSDWNKICYYYKSNNCRLLNVVCVGWLLIWSIG